MITKEASTNFVNFMTKVPWFLELGHGHKSHEVKVHLKSPLLPG